MALQQFTGGTRNNDLLAPRQESTGSDGASNARAVTAIAERTFKEGKAQKAAREQGELVYDFLGQRVETALGTEGFVDLSDEAKDEIVRGVGEFDRHLTQVAAQGGSKVTKAEILRTRKAMEAISRNPAAAESIIKAVGLSDKLGDDLISQVKEEEAEAKVLEKDYADFIRGAAQEYGVIFDADTFQDNEAMIAAYETDPRMQIVRSSSAMAGLAKLNDNKQKATAIERQAGISSELPGYGLKMLDAAKDISGGGKNREQGVLALTAMANEAKAQLSADYPLMDNQQRTAAFAQIDANRDIAVQVANGSVKADVYDLALRQQRLTLGQYSIDKAGFDKSIRDDFGRAQAAADMQLTTARVMNTSIEAAQAIDQIKTDKTNSLYLRSTFEENPNLESSVTNTLLGLATSSSDMARKVLMDIPPSDRAENAVASVELWSKNPELVQNATPEQLKAVVDMGEEGLRGMSETEQAAVLDNFLTNANSPEMKQFMRQNPEMAKSWAKPAANEMKRSVRVMIEDLGNELIQDAVFNPTTAGFGVNAAVDISVAAAQGLGQKILETISKDDSPADQVAKRLKAAAADRADRAYNTIKSDPSAVTMYRNAGHFIEVDEEAARDGEFKLKVKDDIPTFIADEQFIRGLTTVVRNANSTHGAIITDKMGGLQTLRSYGDFFTAYEEVFAGEQSISNFKPEDSTIGSDFQEGQ